MTSVPASIVLLTYNQEQLVEESFLSLLNQDMDDLEIIVSDDKSSDGTWERIQKIADAYSGPKKVILSRNTANLGVVDNYAAAVEKSSGELIFMAAGDVFPCQIAVQSQFIFGSPMAKTRLSSGRCF